MIRLSVLCYLACLLTVTHFKLKLIRSEPSGLLTAVNKDYFRVVNYRELLFNDCGDRVAQLLHVELAVPFSKCRNNDIRQEILIVNTHLLFPHDSSLCLVRLNQVGALAFAFMQHFTLSSYNEIDFNLILPHLVPGIQNPAIC